MARALILCTLFVVVAATGFCDEVALQTARRVAEQKLRHHLTLYGHWNGSPSPAVVDAQLVRYADKVVAYNFSVTPSGHVMVAADDAFSPVLLYSTRSTFVSERVDEPQAIESWIIPEVHRKVRSLDQFRRSGQVRAGSATASSDRIARAWSYFTQSSPNDAFSSPVFRTDSGSPSIDRAATLGPLLTSSWGQADPYNLMTPPDNCSGGANTLAGCVATAWAQVLNYWQWPDQGIGNHSYAWNGQTLSADFNVAYDWANMPDTLDGGSSDTDKDAVAQLIYHVGVAAETAFGCNTSSSSAWADDVLDTYFKYKAMTMHYRTDYDATEWFELFKNELDAATPRPVIFSIFSAIGGHEVVVDGYQDDMTNKVHINFGWPPGNYDGYYDVTKDDDFNTGAYDWYVDTQQYIVVAIEPNYAALPTVNAGTDQSVDENSTVQLSGSASHATLAIDAYQWLQVSGTSVSLNTPTSYSTSFTAPSVTTDSQLVFMLKAVDGQRGVGFDKISVTVRNVESSTPAPTPPSSGSGGGGGCFMSSMN